MFLINMIKWELVWSKYPPEGNILISLRDDDKKWRTPFLIHCHNDNSICFEDGNTKYRFDSFDSFAEHLSVGFADIAWTELKNILPKEDVSFY